MTQQEFLEKMSALLAEYEKSNGTIVGCFLNLDDSTFGLTHSWDEEGFVSANHLAVSFMEKE